MLCKKYNGRVRVPPSPLSNCGGKGGGVAPCHWTQRQIFNNLLLLCRNCQKKRHMFFVKIWRFWLLLNHFDDVTPCFIMFSLRNSMFVTPTGFLVEGREDFMCILFMFCPLRLIEIKQQEESLWSYFQAQLECKGAQAVTNPFSFFSSSSHFFTLSFKGHLREQRKRWNNCGHCAAACCIIYFIAHKVNPNHSSTQSQLWKNVFILFISASLSRSVSLGSERPLSASWWCLEVQVCEAPGSFSLCNCCH